MTPTDARTKWLARELADTKSHLRRVYKRITKYKAMQIWVLGRLEAEQVTVSMLRAEVEMLRDEVERLKHESR